MHRFLKIQKLPFQNLQTVTNTNFPNNPYRFRNCALCKQSVNVTNIRERSTDTSPLIFVSNRKRKKKIRSYAEILEVNDVSTTESRASVQKLKAQDLSLLALEPEIGLGELHKIKSRSKFANNNPVDPILTTIEPEDIENSQNVLADNDLAIEKQVEELHNEELETIPETLIPTGKQREKAGKEEALQRILGAHIEMCIASGNPYRAFSLLCFYRNHNKRKNFTIKSPKIYNTLLHGFATKSNIFKIRELLRLMKEDQIKPNAQSYIAIFECLGRMRLATKSAQIRYYYKMMTEQGITKDDLLNRGSFVEDQRDVILDVFRKIQPDYEPKYNYPEVQYTCPMLRALNVPEQIAPFRQNEMENRLFAEDELKRLTAEQMKSEMDGYVKVRSIESRPEPSKTVLTFRKMIDDVFTSWEGVIEQAFNREMDILKAQPKQGLRTLALDPYLRCLPVSDYIKVILHEIRRLAEGSETYSPTTTQLYRELGSKVYARYQVERKQKHGVLSKVHAIQEAYCNWYISHHGNGGPLNTRQKWQWLCYENQDGASVNGAFHHTWPTTTMIAIGEFLYKIIMHDLKININVLKPSTKEKLLPAFYTIFRSQSRIIKEEVKPHPILVKLFRGSEQEFLKFPAYEVPMKCPPRPWISVTSGGYLATPVDVIRLPIQAVQQWNRLINAPIASLYPALDSLNQLGSIPWKVNKPILDVILKVFNSGGSTKLDVPQPASACPPPPSVTPGMTKFEKFQIFRQKIQARRKRAEMYSLWCDALYRLSLANHYRDDVFWLPHNMDFRGRVYPVPPHLNHLGSDLARSMLVFAKSQPLGRNGLDWLKIHCINLTGLKKRDPIRKRLAYANKIINDILDSADNPLTGKMWWSESDEPWQTLACCMEIANAIRFANPEKYESCYPVHQDGSCNGLQHYAALGRDSAGAFSVNLAPADTPQDVYSAVAALVEEQRSKDAANSLQIAKTLDGFVKRKVIKQTVMTTVYGVTRFGARLQIARQLKDIDTFPKDQVWAASSYLTSKTFESLRTMFTSTREIQDWFTECARLISAVNGQNVEWVTPLGLPVVQPYSRHRKVDQGKRTVPENFSMDMFERPNIMKQKNAFPPNFIHSLDSSHMMLTSLYCEQAGITFVSVHDCFWTHPCSIPVMNKICREQFVTLHSQPILEDLSQFLVRKYSIHSRDLTDDGSVMDITKRKLNRIIQKLPPKGNFDLNSVLNSIYFFS